MRASKTGRNIDVELVFDRPIAGDRTLEKFQRVLERHAPAWTPSLRVRLSRTDERPLNPRDSKSIAKAAIKAMTERGPTFRRLVREVGPVSDRHLGSIELRGVSTDLVVVIDVDERPFSRLGDRGFLGNSVTVQVRGDRLPEGRVTWSSRFFESACGELSPTWASAQATPEYWAKVMSDGPTIQAIGRDFARFLPGLFWLNFFGERYGQFIGADRLRAMPGAHRVGTGVMLELGDNPFAWATPEYQAQEEQVLDQLGRHYFFVKDNPHHVTVAPPWPVDRQL